MQIASDDSHTERPLLSFIGTRTIFYEHSRALMQDGSPQPPANLIQELERCEYESSLGRDSFYHRNTFRWLPNEINMQRFLRHALECAVDSGGLRLHSLYPFEPHLECLDPKLIPPGPLPHMVRIQTSFSVPLAKETIAPLKKRTTRVLLFYNPTGESELPHAKKEIFELAERFEVAGADLILMSRETHEMEIHDLCDEADLIIYSGHGKLIEGNPAMPTTNGWRPLLNPDKTGTTYRKKALIFNACIPDYSGLHMFPTGITISPICRIADRPSNFLHELIAAYIEGSNLENAYKSACLSERERDGMRHLIFRFFGENSEANDFVFFLRDL